MIAAQALPIILASTMGPIVAAIYLAVTLTRRPPDGPTRR